MIGTMSIGEQYTEILRARQATTATPSQKYFIWSLAGLKVHAWVMEAEAMIGIPQVVKYALVLYFIVTLFYLLFKKAPESRLLWFYGDRCYSFQHL
jgi:hypothetical protein